MLASISDISGQKFGAWTAIEQAPRPPGLKQLGTFWRCRCECGNEEIINGGRLRAGRMKRGCLTCSGRLHGKTGRNCSPTYNSWRAMRGRCLRPDDTHFRYYGGRGITICDRWRDSFPNFLADMGVRPQGKSLDRIDVDGPYSPDNCRWADRKTQARNTPRYKITDEQRIAIKEAASYGVPARAIATLCGVARSTISVIVNDLGAYGRPT